MSANLMIPGNLGALPAAASKYRQAGQPNELASGVQAGFAVMGYRGKVWRIKYRGEERDLMRDDGDGPRSSIEAVIVKASPHISKIYYEAGYEDGSNSPPDCWSVNGITPDAGAPKKQSPTCAGCPMNAFGSKITEAGKKAKACADSKRLAIVPLTDIPNEIFGGPMLMRVPAASLQDMAGYANKLDAVGYPAFAVGTRIGFDTKEAYPKLVFSAVRALTDEEFALVEKLRDDPVTSRILNEEIEHVTHPTDARVEDPQVGALTPRPVVQAAAKPAAVAAPKAAAKPAPVAAAPAPAPVAAAPAPAAEDDEEAMLAKQLAALQAKKAAAAAAAKPAPVIEATANEVEAAEPAPVTVEGSAAPADFDAQLAALMGE